MQYINKKMLKHIPVDLVVYFNVIKCNGDQLTMILKH